MTVDTAAGCVAIVLPLVTFCV